MQDNNPYAYAGAVPAIQAAADERATFLKKVYSLLLVGIVLFAGTLWACAEVQPVQDACKALWNMIAGAGRWGWLVYMGIFFGAQFLVHAFAEKKPINLVLYLAWSVLMAFLIAPLVLVVGMTNPVVLTQASLLTAIIFVGLTAVVFFTGKDFSFLRGILGVSMFALIGVAIAGAIFGFTVGLWFSVAAVVLFAGYIVYDTSNILHHYTTNMAVTGAIVLFTDIVLLFKHLLIILSSLNND